MNILPQRQQRRKIAGHQRHIGIGDSKYGIIDVHVGQVCVSRIGHREAPGDVGRVRYGDELRSAT